MVKGRLSASAVTDAPIYARAAPARHQRLKCLSLLYPAQGCRIVRKKRCFWQNTCHHTDLRFPVAALLFPCLFRLFRRLRPSFPWRRLKGRRSCGCSCPDLFVTRNSSQVRFLPSFTFRPFERSDVSPPLLFLKKNTPRKTHQKMQLAGRSSYIRTHWSFHH